MHTLGDTSCKQWKQKTTLSHAAPTEEDLKRESLVLEQLKKRFDEWQEAGFIPSRPIEPGDKTDEPIRTRGWTHWHHLFNPRQLLLNGLISETIYNLHDYPFLMFNINKLLDYSCKNCMWHLSQEKVDHVFSDQSLKVIWNYGSRGSTKVPNINKINLIHVRSIHETMITDAMKVIKGFDIAITDPPYADAVNYDELSEFFLAWLEPHLKKHFPDWYTDSKESPCHPWQWRIVQQIDGCVLPQSHRTDVR